MTTVIPLEDIRRSATAALFQGEDEIPVSVFVTRYEQGQGPQLHFHPYAEVFVVQTGTARFHVAGDELEVSAGHVVVVPPETVHSFKCVDDEVLRVVSVHPSPQVIQTDIE
jgi:quercetin dioxygenase-like cupin family protein